jgi:hypothetical protein
LKKSIADRSVENPQRADVEAQTVLETPVPLAHDLRLTIEQKAYDLEKET